MQAEGSRRQFEIALGALQASSDEYIPDVVRLILTSARAARASDVHLMPTEHCLLMQWRIDGVLHSVTAFDREVGTRLIARLKVIAGLLTYRSDVPQEGRVAREYSSTEVRVSTFPSLYGEKAAVRLFAEQDALQRIQQLGLPDEIARRLVRELTATSGVILLTGPSGSGKTTTAYAALREIQHLCAGTRCLMTLEDPVEVAVDGVTQSQVRPSQGFDLLTGLKSLMRQDPDVILVGEIRDPLTAEAAFQAALTGHLVITTFHAGSAVEALARLLEMQLEPYLIRSALRLVMCQRLVRRTCAECGGPSSATGFDFRNSPELADKKRLAEPLTGSCSKCGASGYFGRLVLSEMLDPDLPEIARALLKRTDAREFSALSESLGISNLESEASRAVRDRLTTSDEVFRVLGKWLSAS